MLPNIPEIKNPEKYSHFRVSREKLEKALENCLRQIDKGIKDYDGTATATISPTPLPIG